MQSIVLAACANPDQQSCSSGYGVSETFFGTGGQLCIPGTSGYSTNYCAKSSVGELGVGNTLGTLYQAQAGFNTNREPSLTVLVNDSQCPDYDAANGASRSLDLSATQARYTNINFSVLTYLASGYVVQTVGAAPTYAGGHTLNTLNNGTSNPGTEQFGMNLEQNTNPTTGSGTVGSGPTQLPDISFGFGQVAAPGANSLTYNSSNHYSYRNNDTIAFSNSSSGVTCYDTTYLFNISNVTPAGSYIFDQSIVVTSTF